MKLSEAILLGSVGTGQAFGVFRDDEGNTCALGSAFVAVGLQFDGCFGLRFGRGSQECPQEWRWIFTPIPIDDIPEKNTHEQKFKFRHHVPIWMVIPYLNDVCEWTRPKIAEWVKAMEAIYDPDHTTQSVKEVEHATT